MPGGSINNYGMIMQYIKINILDESLRKFSRCSFNMSFLINVISLYLWNHDHIIWGYGTNNSKSIAYFLLDQFLHADSYMWFHQESSCEVILCFKIQNIFIETFHFGHIYLLTAFDNDSTCFYLNYNQCSHRLYISLSFDVIRFTEYVKFIY